MRARPTWPYHLGWRTGRRGESNINRIPPRQIDRHWVIMARFQGLSEEFHNRINELRAKIDYKFGCYVRRLSRDACL